MDKPFALVIEDDGNIAALYRQVDLAGSQTEIIFHGQIAVERLSKSQPDIVLLDLSLPGISGNWILEWIRQDGRLNHTKVLVITAHAHLAGGLIVQPDLLLQKPFSVDQLSHVIGRIILPEKSPKAVRLRQKPLDESTGLYTRSFSETAWKALKQSKEIDHYLCAVLLFKMEPRNKNTIHRTQILGKQFCARLRLHGEASCAPLTQLPVLTRTRFMS